jgi:hypothetical protein
LTDTTVRSAFHAIGPITLDFSSLVTIAAAADSPFNGIVALGIVNGAIRSWRFFLIDDRLAAPGVGILRSNDWHAQQVPMAIDAILCHN